MKISKKYSENIQIIIRLLLLNCMWRVWHFEFPLSIVTQAHRGAAERAHEGTREAFEQLNSAVEAWHGPWLLQRWCRKALVSFAGKGGAPSGG